MAKKILIVEDNLQNMDVIEMTLGARDYVLVKATDGEEALAVAGRERPDLIIMDIQLPKINGLEVTRKLRKNPAFRHTPIIGVTAYAMKDDEEKVIAAGCDTYLSKPFSIHTLRDVVAELLSRRQKDNP